MLTERIIDTKVETAIDNNTNNGRYEATIESYNAIRGQSLLIHINQPIELTRSTALC